MNFYLKHEFFLMYFKIPYDFMILQSEFVLHFLCRVKIMILTTLATRINRCLLLAFRLTCLITLIPHFANGHWDVKLNRGVEGTFILSLYTWYLWYLLTYSIQSLSMVIKKYKPLCELIGVLFFFFCPI